MKDKQYKNNKGKGDLSDMKFHLTKEGSLGILAYGDIALLAWRKVKNS